MHSVSAFLRVQVRMHQTGPKAYHLACIPGTIIKYRYWDGLSSQSSSTILLYIWFDCLEVRIRPLL